jgi:hypothetical protein
VRENLSVSPNDTRPRADSFTDRYGSSMATGRQISAARALLGPGWTQTRLAQQAGVSPASVQRAERAEGIPQMLSGGLFAIVRALERAGIIFIDADESAGPGVRLRRPR